VSHLRGGGCSASATHEKEALVAEIRVEKKEKRSMLPWILGLLLLALVLWGISEMMGGDDDTVEETGASAVGVTIQQQPPALRQYAVLTAEVLADAA
jgi:hypothetical protein